MSEAQSVLPLTGDTSDGVRIATTLRSFRHSKLPLVILLHGFSSSQNNSLNRALYPVLEELGFNSLAFDFRGCGASSGQLETTTITNGLLDLTAALVTARNEIPSLLDRKVILIGSSFGGAVALAASPTLNPSAILLKSPMLDIFRAQLARRGQVEMQRWREQGYLEIESGRGTVKLNYEYVADAMRYDLVRGDLGNEIPCVHIVHGTEDEVAPIEHVAEFVDFDAEHRILVPIEGADHHYGRPSDFEVLSKTFADRLRVLAADFA